MSRPSSRRTCIPAISCSSRSPSRPPLAWYYLPGGLRYATALGPDTHPTYMNWDGADRAAATRRSAGAARAAARSLSPGQRLVYIRPLTEGQSPGPRRWAQAGAPPRGAVGRAALRRRRELTPIPGACGAAQLPRLLLRGQQRIRLHEAVRTQVPSDRSPPIWGHARACSRAGRCSSRRAQLRDMV